MPGHLEQLTQYRILVIGDFNLDQMLTENVARVGIKIDNVFFNDFNMFFKIVRNWK